LAAPSSGDFTALVQLLADNPDGKLWPGAFTTVHFHIPSDPNVLRIPATALIFGPHGMQVAKVDAENKVVLRNVQLGRNLGNYVEVSSGVSLSDRLIDSPQETIAPGDTVRIASAQIKARQGARWNKRARLKGTRRIATRRRSALPGNAYGA
jgi:membrane fusion protein, multidrug efflux system